METQSITQTINVQIGDAVAGLASTGTSTILTVAIALSLIAISLLIWHFGFRRTNRKLSVRGAGLSVFALLAVAGLTFNLSSVSAVPTITLAANQETITINVPKGNETDTFFKLFPVAPESFMKLPLPFRRSFGISIFNEKKITIVILKGQHSFFYFFEDEKISGDGKEKGPNA